MEITEIRARRMTRCLGCGRQKMQGPIVCWECFKEGDDPYKYTKLSLNVWAKAKRAEFDTYLSKIEKEDELPTTVTF